MIEKTKSHSSNMILSAFNYHYRSIFYFILIISLLTSCFIGRESLIDLQRHLKLSLRSKIKPFRLSHTEYYNQNFIQTTNLSRPIYSIDLLKEALENQTLLAKEELKISPIPSSFRILNGITVNAGLVSDGYIHDHLTTPYLCLGRLHGRVPYNAPLAKPMCLAIVRNSFVGGSGVSLTPSIGTIREISGGCCLNDWPRYINKTISFTTTQLNNVKKNNGKIILVLAQHHGTTYHHVIHEVLSRYLSVLPIIDAIPQIYVLIDDSDVAFDLLTLIGLDEKRIIRNIPFGKVDWKFASVLLYPKTLFQHAHGGYFPKDKHVHATAGVLRGAVQQVPHEDKRDNRKILLLMERAVRRHVWGCNEQRCVRNFKQLHRNLKEVFGHQYKIQIYRARDDMRTAIHLFSVADVVVGVHGAGFQNLMFCKPNTTVVHIGWGIHYKYLADDFGLRYHLSKVPHMRLGDKNFNLDVQAITKDVKNAISEDITENETIRRKWAKQKQ